MIELISSSDFIPNRTWNWNKTVIEFCAGIGTALHLPFNTERLLKLTENYVVSTKKLRTALGIQNMPVSAQEGFIKTLKSFEKT